MSVFFRGRTWQAILLLFVFSLTLVLVTLLPIANAAPAQVVEDGADGVANANPQFSHRLIVQLESPALAEVMAATGLSPQANGRLDVQSTAAQAYISQLKAEQAVFVAEMAKAMPDASVAAYINEAGQSVEATYQIVFNGMAVDPGTKNITLARKTLSQLPGVRGVYLDFARQPDTYASMPLINAPALWSQLGGQDAAGDGVKVASMDGGLHHDAAMFDGTGFAYPAGAPFNGGGLGDAANNNGKIIVSRAYFRDWDPPAVGDENTWPGENGTSHGTHTGSTTAGNVVVADYLGITETVSGVAPGAWLMSYRVFYASVSGDGSFYNVEGIAALEDIVADGADVVNNSWGGGPGSVGGEFDPLDTALINASNAGVFVSMSAGNAGPGLGTGDHPSADYINVAASTTDGTYAAGRLNVIAPTPISATLQGMGFGQALFGPPLPVGSTITHTFISADSVDPANVTGCSAWTGTPFTGNAAVISRGGCFFGNKVYYAQQAGAEFVVIYNNSGDGTINMAFGCDYGAGCSASDITISSLFIGQTDGNNMVDWYAAKGAASVLEVDTLAFQAGNTADQIIGFSSRGPGMGNVLKPDIAAPGVNILAQGYGVGSGEARHLGFGQVSGTSMASPHVAGAATLLRQIHPGWSNAYIKSALMSTSKYMGIYNQQDGSPAQPLDMGAGRLDLTNAADPGVILDPPSLSYGLMTTGTVKSIQVQVTSVATATETYTLSSLYTGNGFAITQTTVLTGFTFTPASLVLAPSASGTFTVTFDSATGMGFGDNQGYIILDGDQGYEAHMPAWARVAPAAASADVLVIDNDFSWLFGFPDYLSYYTDALDNLGLTYDVRNTDIYFANSTTIPDAATLSTYKAVVYFTGDNFYPDGTFTVQTPLTRLDMNRLNAYANGGGIVIAMGQDMSAVLNDSFFDDFTLGDEQLQDSLTGFALPTLPVVPFAGAPAEFQGISLDLSDIDTYMGTVSMPDTLVAPYTVYLPLVMGGTGATLPAAPTGTATFTFDVASNRLDYDVTINATDPVTITAAHIHEGTSLETGAILYPLYSSTTPVTGTLNFTGAVVVDSADVAALLSDGLYLNVHSADRPASAVRAQVVVAAQSDGANNQYYIDEMKTMPNVEPNPVPGVTYPYAPLLKYPGPYNLEDGVVAMAHRDQPTLENPGLNYYGRSIYTSFGLEGVNDAAGFTSRDGLLGAFMDWAMDEPTVVISDVTSTYTNTTYTTFLQATMDSNITGTTGVSYRWDFGDGSDFAGPYGSSIAGYDYAACGGYTVRVEATDSWGNVVIGELDITVTQCP